MYYIYLFALNGPFKRCQHFAFVVCHPSIDSYSRYCLTRYDKEQTFFKWLNMIEWLHRKVNFIMFGYLFRFNMKCLNSATLFIYLYGNHPEIIRNVNYFWKYYASYHENLFNARKKQKTKMNKSSFYFSKKKTITKEAIQYLNVHRTFSFSLWQFQG